MSGHWRCESPAASPNPERNQVSDDLDCVRRSGIAELTGSGPVGLGLGQEGACHQPSPARGADGWLGRAPEEWEMLVPSHFGCTLRHPCGFGGCTGLGDK